MYLRDFPKLLAPDFRLVVMHDYYAVNVTCANFTAMMRIQGFNGTYYEKALQFDSKYKAFCELRLDQLNLDEFGD